MIFSASHPATQSVVSRSKSCHFGTCNFTRLQRRTSDSPKLTSISEFVPIYAPAARTTARATDGSAVVTRERSACPQSPTPRRPVSLRLHKPGVTSCHANRPGATSPSRLMPGTDQSTPPAQRPPLLSSCCVGLNPGPAQHPPHSRTPPPPGALPVPGGSLPAEAAPPDPLGPPRPSGPRRRGGHGGT